MDLSGVKQRSVLSPRKIKAAEVRAVECDARDQQRLAILAWRLDPIPAARRAIGRIDPFRDDAFDIDLMRVRPDGRPVRLEMLDVTYSVERWFERLAQQLLALKKWEPSEVFAVFIEQIECEVGDTLTDAFRVPLYGAPSSRTCRLRAGRPFRRR